MPRTPHLPGIFAVAGSVPGWMRWDIERQKPQDGDEHPVREPLYREPLPPGEGPPPKLPDNHWSNDY